MTTSGKLLALSFVVIFLGALFGHAVSAITASVCCVAAFIVEVGAEASEHADPQLAGNLHKTALGILLFGVLVAAIGVFAERSFASFLFVTLVGLATCIERMTKTSKGAS